MSTMFSDRQFLQNSPSLNSISWQVEKRRNDKYIVPEHFYGKFTLHWKGTTIGIHSYGEHGDAGQANFEIKCELVIELIESFLSHVHAKSFACRHVMLNGPDTPFSGSIYFKVGETPSGIPVCVFEFASCKGKIRLHAHELRSTEELINVLGLIKDNIETLLVWTKNWRNLDVAEV